MGSSRTHRRVGTAVLAGFLMGAVVGLTACDGGGENPSSLPSARSSERSFERPASGEADATETSEPERTTKPAESTPSPTSTPATRTLPARTTKPADATTTTTAAEPAEPTKTTQPAKTTQPTQAAQPTRTTPATPTTTPAQAAASPSAAAVAADSASWGPLAWLLVIALVAALIIGGLFVYRSQRRSAWDTEARALESETRAITATRLPPVLSTTTASQRGLAWPPVRIALDDLVNRWNALIERASGEARRNWSLRISGLLQELIAAVDSENEAMAAGDDWTLLRPRVTQAENALASALAVQPRPEPPPAGQPGPSASPA